MTRFLERLPAQVWAWLQQDWRATVHLAVHWGSLAVALVALGLAAAGTVAVRRH